MQPRFDSERLRVRVALGAALVASTIFTLVHTAHAELPRPVTDLRSLLEQTACLVEGDVKNVEHSFDDRKGPRANVLFTNVRTLLGDCGSGDLKLRMFGGPLPSGAIVVASEMPRFVRGARYVVFLRNTEWFYTPVHFGDVLRVERVGVHDVLVDEVGRALRGIALEGLAYHDTPLFEPMRDLLAQDPPRLLPGAEQVNLEVKLDAEQLARRLQQFAELEQIEIQGTFQGEPRADRIWNKVPTTPYKGELVPPGPKEPPCDPTTQSCAAHFGKGAKP